MTKQNHKTGILVAGMVICAIVLRVLGKLDILIVPGGIVRLLIYIAHPGRIDRMVEGQ